MPHSRIRFVNTAPSSTRVHLSKNEWLDLLDSAIACKFFPLPYPPPSSLVPVTAWPYSVEVPTTPQAGTFFLVSKRDLTCPILNLLGVGVQQLINGVLDFRYNSFLNLGSGSLTLSSEVVSQARVLSLLIMVLPRPLFPESGALGLTFRTAFVTFGASFPVGVNSGYLSDTVERPYACSLSFESVELTLTEARTVGFVFEECKFGPSNIVS
jgi:hypothetical protein